jgi:hypothetical protein
LSHRSRRPERRRSDRGLRKQTLGRGAPRVALRWKVPLPARSMRGSLELDATNLLINEDGSNGAGVGRSRRTLQLRVKSENRTICRGLASRTAGSETRTGKRTAVCYRSAGDPTSAEPPGYVVELAATQYQGTGATWCLTTSSTKSSAAVRKSWVLQSRPRATWNDLVDTIGTMNGFDTSLSLVGEFL